MNSTDVATFMPKGRTTPDPRTTRFGRFARRLRKARGLTQETLAELADLSADTIRRLEHGDFAPSLTTLAKLGRGLGLSLATIFEAFELRDLEPGRELIDLARSLTDRERAMALRVLSLLVVMLRGVGGEGGRDE